jgi:hypothetical protein
MPTVRGDDELDLELDLLAARHPVPPLPPSPPSPPYSHDELFFGAASLQPASSCIPMSQSRGSLLEAVKRIASRARECPI